MHQLNREMQDRIWSGNKTRYKGFAVADGIIAISKKFVGSMILDVGAGDGSLVKRLRKVFPLAKLEAVDTVPKDPCVSYGSCTNLPYPSDTFDTVFITDVIEHLADDDLILCLEELRRVVRRDGYVVVNTLNDENFSESSVTCPYCDREFHRWGHTRTFTPQSLVSLLHSHGFEVLVMKTLNIHLLAIFPLLMSVFYMFHLEVLVKEKILKSDLFVVARKINKP